MNELSSPVQLAQLLLRLVERVLHFPPLDVRHRSSVLRPVHELLLSHAELSYYVLVVNVS
jgi:hypothetical protein